MLEMQSPEMWFYVWLVLCSVGAPGIVRSDSYQWWRYASVYQIYTRSFKDSDGDGVGDLRGVIQKAEYLKDLGVDAIWLSPIFQSPMIDFGYDISDFKAVDPQFGTINDFDHLMAKMNELDIKVLLDFVPNHSSDQHPWFRASRDPAHPLYSEYRDFYVWADPNGTVDGAPRPPNNWASLFGGPAWSYCYERKQFYLHHFFKQLPDLNLRNPNVVSNLSSVLDWWMARGASGFRLGAAPHLVEHADLPSEPAVPGTAGDSWPTLRHLYMMDQPETLPLLRGWADRVSQRADADGRQRVLFVEIYGSVNTSMKYYGTGDPSLQIPFNYNLVVQGRPAMTAPKMKAIITEWMDAKPLNAVTAWVVSNNDYGRVSSRYGADLVDAMALVTGTLPGVQFTYYGDELGMENTFVPPGRVQDPAGTRDALRTPMQWDDTPHAGFSEGNVTWLPVNSNYWRLNVARQREDSSSHLKVFQVITLARKNPVMRLGSIDILAPDNDTIIIVRSLDDSHFVLIVNLGSEMRSYTSQDLSGHFGHGSLEEEDLAVVVGSVNSGFKTGYSFQKGSLQVDLRPKSAVLLSTESAYYLSSASLLHLDIIGYTIILISCSIIWMF